MVFIQTAEGRAVNSAGTYSYQYNLTDQLGNVRYSFDIYAGAVRKLQEDDYYPFGKRKTVTGGNNNYLYNGKEMQNEFYSPYQQDGQYDYGARFYDPVIGRWNVIDPMAEDYDDVSPYNYGLNNPFLMIDPDGMATVSSNGGTDSITDPKAILLKEVVINAPKRKPFIGFWPKLGYFLNGGHYDGYTYNLQGKAVGLAPIAGYPPGLSRNGVSWKNVTSMIKSIRSLFASSKAPASFLQSLNKTISIQKQARHLLGTSNGGGYLKNTDEAQAVLNAVHAGEAEFIGTMKAGHQVFKFTGVTGTNVNAGAGIQNQTTNLFMIKGTSSPSVVPINPNWKP